MFIYGRNSIEEALTEGLFLQRILVENGKGEKFANLLSRARQAEIPVSFLPLPTLEKTLHTRKHQGIGAEIALPANITEDPDAEIDWTSFDTILTLDGITDTGNLGAILRSALLLGAGAVVLPNDNSARITPAAVKSSAGAVFKQRIIYIDNINTFLMELKSCGFTVTGLAGEVQDKITAQPFSGKVCLVVGSEDKGLRKSVRKICDSLVSIPTTRKLDSLNASVASALALWEVFRKRLDS